MKYKELLAKIEKMLSLGATKAQIFSEIGMTDDNARILASTPTLKKRAEYKTLNQILAVIVLYYAAVKFAFSCYNFISLGLPIYTIPIVLFVPICAIALVIGIIKFQGYSYLAIGLLGVVAIIKGINVQVASYDPTFWAIWVAIYIPVASGTFLAFYLKKKLCPHLAFMGAKTDDSGHYLFLQEQTNQSQENDA